MNAGLGLGGSEPEYLPWKSWSKGAKLPNNK